MTKRITGKKYGAGKLGMTMAHMTDTNEPVMVRKDHISCQVYGKLESLGAFIGDLKAHLNSTNKETEILVLIQNALMNIGSMIFKQSHATYETTFNNLIQILNDRLSYITIHLTSTDFILWGADIIHAKWGIVTTQIRETESKFIKWINEYPISQSKLDSYTQVIGLLNLLSKWSYYESRYHLELIKVKPEEWKPTIDLGDDYIELLNEIEHGE